MAEWQPIETAPRSGESVLLFTTSHGIVEAWFAPGEWSVETPISPAEYIGPVWVCADDAFEIEVEEFGGEVPDNHGAATHWMPLPEPPNA